MLRLPRFRYLAPGSLAEAARILAAEGPGAIAVAGGTDLYPNMKRRHQTPAMVVALRRIAALAGVQADTNGGVRIGACASLTEVSSNPRLRETWPALAHAAGVISTPVLRNMGTIGGNICLDTRCTYYNQSYEWRRSIDFCMKCDGSTCWVAPASKICLAINSSDTAPVLCAIGARVRLISENGERELPVSDLYRKDGINYLTKRREEIVSEVILPPADGWKATYFKLARRAAFDFPVLGIAIAARKNADGTVADSRIWLNAVASAPLRATEAEQLLVGHTPDQDLLHAVAELAARPAKPMDNADLNYAWRKSVAKVYAKRALAEVLA